MKKKDAPILSTAPNKILECRGMSHLWEVAHWDVAVIEGVVHQVEHVHCRRCNSSREATLLPDEGRRFNTATKYGDGYSLADRPTKRQVNVERMRRVLVPDEGS